jgi:RES domain-containing protein
VIVTQIPDGHVWLRITRPHYADPFDPSFAQRRGGRWNPPGSWPTLYLNEDLATVHAQVRHLFTGRGVEPDDLDDDAPIRLAACTLPGRQRVADVITDSGVEAVGLPSSYPSDADGARTSHATTQAIGADAHGRGLRGVWCRSAAGIGHELAWFPTDRSAARPVWRSPRPYGAWRTAVDLSAVTDPNRRNVAESGR